VSEREWISTEAKAFMHALDKKLSALHGVLVRMKGLKQHLAIFLNGRKTIIHSFVNQYVTRKSLVVLDTNISQAELFAAQTPQYITAPSRKANLSLATNLEGTLFGEWCWLWSAAVCTGVLLLGHRESSTRCEGASVVGRRCRALVIFNGLDQYGIVYPPVRCLLPATSQAPRLLEVSNQHCAAKFNN
jgi:hypothetical protein